MDLWHGWADLRPGIAACMDGPKTETPHSTSIWHSVAQCTWNCHSFVLAVSILRQGLLLPNSFWKLSSTFVTPPIVSLCHSLEVAYQQLEWCQSPLCGHWDVFHIACLVTRVEQSVGCVSACPDGSFQTTDLWPSDCNYRSNYDNTVNGNSLLVISAKWTEWTGEISCDAFFPSVCVHSVFRCK